MPPDAATADPPAGLFAVACPKCAAALGVERLSVGNAAECPVCQSRFLVPEPRMPATPPTADLAGAAAQDRLMDRLADDLSAAQAQPSERHRDMEVREPVKTVLTAEGEIELRQLSEDEKRARRTRRNLVMLVVGAAFLMMLTLILGRKRTPQRPASQPLADRE